MTIERLQLLCSLIKDRLDTGRVNTDDQQTALILNLLHIPSSFLSLPSDQLIQRVGDAWITLTASDDKQ